MEKLLDTIQAAGNILADELLAYVKEYGEDYADNPEYWSNEFGIYEEDGYKVTKVLDFFGNEGCESITQRNTNPDIDIDSLNTLDELLEVTDNNFTHNSFLQLYIEVDASGNEDLKYYCLFNDGIAHSDVLSEPDHGYVRDLNLSDIENIIFAIHKTFKS